MEQWMERSQEVFVLIEEKGWFFVLNYVQQARLWGVIEIEIGPWAWLVLSS